MPDSHWHHIEGKSNPADLATRGISTNFLSSSELWWHGPQFLCNSIKLCETSSSNYSNTDCPERRITCQTAAVIEEPQWDFILKQSSYSKLLRITAWCNRYILNLRLKLGKSPLFQSNILSPFEIKYAEICLTRNTQIVQFPSEYRVLSQGRNISLKSVLYNLNVYFDLDTMCLRVNGRLRYDNLSPDEKFPLVLKSDSHFSQLLIKDRHLKSFHGCTYLISY